MHPKKNMNRTDIFPPFTEREIEGAEIARTAAEEGMVLLKNDNGALPLSPGKIALYGTGAVRTVRGGTGSGDPFNGGLSGGGEIHINQSPRYHINIMPALEAAGFTVVNAAEMNALSAEYDKTYEESYVSFFLAFRFPEKTIAEASAREASARTDTAVYVISRISGEGSDRKLEDDYHLTQAEKENLALLRSLFSRLVILLNVGGPVCGADLLASDPDAVLLIGQGGQEGGEAVANVLSGRVSPSGKLTDSWAMQYEDYPSAATYLKDWDNSFYTEGIYVGYRYFDTFDREPAWPFGFGLSYTDFSLSMDKGDCFLEGEDLCARVKVRNSGNAYGREVVQVYVSAPSTELDMPYQELKGFEKTKLLAPGGEETVTVRIPVVSLASYSEAHGGYILSRGYYIVRVGDSSQDTVKAAALHISQTVPVVRVEKALPLAQELNELTGLSGDDNSTQTERLPILEPENLPACEERVSPYRDEAVPQYQSDGRVWQFSDLKAGRCSLSEFVAQLSEDDLAVFACGTGWGVSDDNDPIVGANSESVPGAAGETARVFEKYGVPTLVLADGPGGVRVAQHFTATNIDTGQKQEVYHHCIAWPIGTLIAQSFDRQLAKTVGLAMQADLAAMKIQVFLAPGVNIHRNPLCGRNFEYFSEDPLLSGEIGAAVTLGIQQDSRAAACLKHYAGNNQETNRAANNSVIGQRALREIYLEPFRIGVVKGRAMSMMTAYNKLNGVPCADSYDLCTNLARGEWGFDGLIMTDWNGGSSTPYKSMHAGNDLIMPGGESRVRNILNGVRFIPPQFDERGAVDRIQTHPVARFYQLLWNGFTPDPEGEEIAEAPLGEGQKAEIKDGLILVNGEPLYMEAGTIGEAMKNRDAFKPLKRPATTADASVSEDGRRILYRGWFKRKPQISVGDLQQRAASILKVMLFLA